MFILHYVGLIGRSPDLHSTQTTANLAALLLAPINSYQSVLTLLALQRYSSLLALQPFSTRRSLAHALISSVLKNETIIEAPEDVNGILELCHVLIRDQQDGTANTNLLASQASVRERRGGSYLHEKEETAEEQGWIARMVHLFRAESLDVQFEVRAHMFVLTYLVKLWWALDYTNCTKTLRNRWRSDAVHIPCTHHICNQTGAKVQKQGTPGKLCMCTSYMRCANCPPQEEDWQSKAQSILKFVRQLANILATTVEAPSIALRLFLLAAQISDECGFEDLTYDLYVQAFTVYEDSISESRAQLQAITLIIGTLQGAKVFSEDNYDTLITKAALHGARLLKKPHQATAVNLASHLWWQEIPPEDEPVTKEAEKPATPKDDTESPKAVSDLVFCILAKV